LVLESDEFSGVGWFGAQRNGEHLPILQCAEQGDIIDLARDCFLRKVAEHPTWDKHLHHPAKHAACEHQNQKRHQNDGEGTPETKS
jgi:hypothetical protein